MEKCVFTSGEAAKICHASIQTMNRWLNEGELKGYRPTKNSHRRISKKELIKFMKKNEFPLEFQREDIIKVLIADNEKKITAIEGKYNSLYESSKDGIAFCDMQGNILEANRSFLDMIGYTIEEVKKMTYQQMTPEKWYEMEEDIIKNQIIARGYSDEYEKEYITKNGTVFPIMIRSWVIRDEKGKPIAMWALVRDITERKRAEEALRESEKRFKQFFENTPEYCYIISLEGKIIDINKSALKVLGYKKEEIIGKPLITTIYTPSSREKAKKLLMEWKKTGKLRDEELNILTKSGEERIILLSADAFRDQKGNIIHSVSVQRDITERKRAEEELKKHREHLQEIVKERTSELEKKSFELEQANIRLQETDRLKSVFLANMSHELRTPLNSVIGFTCLILQGMVGEINEEQRKQLTIVKNSAYHLLRLINEFFDVSKIEAGKLELTFEEFSLNDIVREVVEILTPRTSKKGLEILTDMPEVIMIFSDKKRLKQILLNLVTNAVKFTDKGSVKIAAKSLNDKSLEICVIDTGIGIRKEDMNKLFAPFQQIDMSSTKSHEGTGLGLHLSRKLATLLGGDISAKSKYGKGSEFILTVPLEFKENK